MALMERVATLIRANLNDLIEQAEDPDKTLKQVMLDMQNQLMQVKTQVAIAIAELATRGVSPGTPAMVPDVIEPETSSASMCFLPVGSTLLKAR